ncbi:MAG: Smr/MutS family protein [Spirochaetales bacterium]|jgi:dsDNA-specific endonuclease/ATPase MutS2|nr:Smr/MutS family protein [Spirochaetales bacterium]
MKAENGNPMEKWLEAFPPPKSAGADREAVSGGEGSRADSSGGGAASGPRGGKSAFKKEDKLDLHGMTREEAQRRLGDFITARARKGRRKVLIIHGRGLNSGGEAVLPQLVRSELEKNPHVVDFGSAGPSDGGAGALCVFLSRR